MPDLKGRLSDRQRRFIAAYVADPNATAAAEAAGYATPRTRAQKLLAQAPIAAAIAEARDKAAKKAEVDAEWVLKRLKANAVGALRDKDRAAANGALKLLGESLGMFAKKVEHSGPGGGEIAHSVTVNVTRRFVHAQMGELTAGVHGDN